jgi:ribonuclease HII
MPKTTKKETCVLSDSLTVKAKKTRQLLSPVYNSENKYEIGIDEAGRGPLFGRLYVAATILPKDDSFRHAEIRDSKKFTSKKKITELAEYIKSHSIAWSIQYIDADEIDRINIRQAVLKAMHQCIRDIIDKIKSKSGENTVHLSDFMLLVDGNDFTPYTVYDEATESMQCVRHETIEGGDNLYTPIAAASILAKVERDEYIAKLCEEYPDLISRYHLDSNMGYGTAKHLDGIVEHGITQFHRRSYGRCKEAEFCPL